ncbi:MAG: arginase family protein [Candidatus Nanohaloarchaea archaeon]
MKEDILAPTDCDILIQKLPSDMGIHRNDRKGTLKAPEKILESLKFDQDVLIDEVFSDEFDLEETQQRIEKNTQDLARHGKPILSVGGDHSVSYPVIKGLKEKYPDLKLVWLDSHLDLKRKVNGHVSHDVVVRQLLEERFSDDEIVFVGCKRIDSDEEEFLEDHDLRVFGPDELEDFLREFSWSEHPVYLSVDIDVLKKELAPGTGYPDGGLSLSDAKGVIEAVELDHADLVEVAPPLDEDGKTVDAAESLIEFMTQRLNLSTSL